ncbi:hypothetical protein [Methylobacterium brachiatum]|uniref:hypothetical protein n=1 Tax=Methylobacterium brachiatum TaxID=269660 RepID=UPI00111459F4|nr:hypothetical protein [Methylobacterium brachiatum]
MGSTISIEPIHLLIAGTELVTIPAWHYAELLEHQRAARTGGLLSAQMWAHPALLAIDPRSRLFGDPEVAVFLFGALGRMKLADATVACRQRFGADRSPSKATIGRYWQRLRKP